MRIGLVGVGAWGRNVLRDLLSLECEVTAVGRSESSRAAALDAGATAWVDRLDDLPPVDGVVVVVPVSVHAEVLDQVLTARDVPVFVEKPLTCDPRSARRLADRGRDRLFVMDKWRYHPGVEALRDLGRAGDIGPVQGLRTTRVQWRSTHHDVDGVWVLAPHDLSVALEILGGIPEPRAAVAHRSEAGTTLVGLLGLRPWMTLEVSTAAPGWRREIVVHFETGAARLSDGYADHITVIRSDGDEAETRLSVSTELPLLRELRAFVEHLRGGPPPRSSAAEGAAVVEAVARLRQLAGLP